MKRHTYFILFVLAGLFILPGGAAYLFYQHPQWLGTTTTNRGTFVSPPVQFVELSNDKKKWKLIAWSPTQCDDQCERMMDELARVRLALGRRLYDVEVCLLIKDAPDMISQRHADQLKEEDINVVKLPLDALQSSLVLGRHPRLFIANPDNYLVLKYVLPVKPEDIFHDIKLLLKKE